MSVSFRSVNSDRQKWEDRVNASFAKIKSDERVCFHADCTVTSRGGRFPVTECDYCPAWLMSDEGPVIPLPWYFRDPDPLHI